MKKVDITHISGGAHPAFYPVAGCGSFMLLQYIDNPKSTAHDYGRSCLHGAVHSMNPALGMTSRIGNGVLRYTGGIAYGAGVKYGMNTIFRDKAHQKADSCQFDLDLYTMQNFASDD